LFVANEIIWSLYVLFLALIAMVRKKLTLQPSSLTLLLSVPLVWGLIMSFDKDLLNTAKGFFYLSIPLIMILIGLQMSKIYDEKQFFSFVRTAGNVIALLFIFFTIMRAGFIAFISPYTEARFVVGSGSPACVLSLILGIYSDKFGLSLYKNATSRWFSILINLIAIYLFASRTYWVMLFLFIIIFSLKTMRKDKLLFFILIFASCLILLTVWINSKNNLSFNNSILFKLVHSFNEIKLSDLKTRNEINIYYRGYESYRSWQTFKSGNLPELLFGGGFGQMVDLKTEVLLAGEYWKSVPWVHNGFFFVLVKLGAFGLISILLFFIYLADQGIRGFGSKDRLRQFQSILILCCAASVFMTNFVDCGLYNFEMSLILITLGFLIATHLTNSHPIRKGDSE
jgi:hypothetical protein